MFHVKHSACDRAEQGIVALCARYGLDGVQQRGLAGLVRIVMEDDLAPTSVREAAAVVDAHLADSLVALTLEPVRSAGTIADIGSGAGFPGLALAVGLPDARVALVESQARKCAFLERAAKAGGAGNARVVCSRAEEWAGGIGHNDLVVARAVGPQPVVMEYAAPLLKVGGALVDWRGRREEGQERAAAAAAGELGLELAEVRAVKPFDAARDRHLHLYLKVRPTPDRYPRRAGIARKRPLG